jgi:membrane protein DedA with SNARE-associated domain
MSAGSQASSTRVWHARRGVRIAALTVLIGAAILVSAILQGEVPEAVSWARGWIRPLLQRYSYMAGYGLLYIEESGIPLPVPGDIFVMYVGAHVPRNLLSWLAAWLGLIGVVVLGSTNLFFISRRFGRRLAHSRFAHVVHLSPERLERAERWFARYGVLAIIFGRHIPGFRVPITLAAGVFRVRYPVFAASVAVSTAIWAGVFLIVGINFGGRLEAFLRVHREASWLFVAFIVVAVTLSLLQRRRPAATVSLEKP